MRARRLCLAAALIITLRAWALAAPAKLDLPLSRDVFGAWAAFPKLEPVPIFAGLPLRPRGGLQPWRQRPCSACHARRLRRCPRRGTEPCPLPRPALTHRAVRRPGCTRWPPQCFEGMKAYRGLDGECRLFRPEMNVARLNKSASRLALPVRGGKLTALHISCARHLSRRATCRAALKQPLPCRNRGAWCSAN